MVDKIDNPHLDDYELLEDEYDNLNLPDGPNKPEKPEVKES